MGTSFQRNVVVRCKEVIHVLLVLVHAGTAEPLRVSPPEAVAYLLELGEKTESHAVRASGACEPKNVAISAYLSHVLRQNTTHFSHGTALV